MSVDLQFLGAAETVTGSRFVLRLNNRHILIDCGLFQGGRRLKEANWEPFPVPPKQIDAVLLTHAHIDHSGYLPRLVQQGYGGPIYATEATCALLNILLPDSAYLNEQDAAYANKKGYGRHRPTLPLYTTADAQATLRLLTPVRFDSPLHLDGVDITWRPAGHLLGSAILQVNLSGTDHPRQIVFSGDLGRYDGAVMKSPTTVTAADTLIVESTYGGRRHSDDDIDAKLTEVTEHILKWRLPDPNNVVLFVGYQAEGTRGRRLLNGAKRTQIHGEDIPVRARIASLHALSGHADHDELLRWLEGFARPPRQTFIVHGEPEAAQALMSALDDRGWTTTIPTLGQSCPILE